jgi:hypothetical protein
MLIIVTLANLATLAIYTTLLYIGVDVADRMYFGKLEKPKFHEAPIFVRRLVLLHGVLLGAVFIVASREWVFAHAFGSIATAIFMGFLLGWLFEYGLLYSFGIPRVLSSE